MKLVLFSNPDNGMLDKLEKKILPTVGLFFGYMPADGNDPKPEYMPFWEDFAKRNQARLIYLDNSKKPTNKEMEDINNIDSLLITGGNVYQLLSNLRKSEYDTVIKKLATKKDFIFSGFSAGAIIATPDIRVAAKDNGWSFGYDENKANIKDTKALGLVDFEILPHYQKGKDDENIKKFEQRYQNKLKPLSDKDCLIIEKDS